jgi:hypothetical protein
MSSSKKRGSAPGRERSKDQRPRTVQREHKKYGGRQRGTPSAFSADYKKAVFEAAYRIGLDGNGKYGMVGYFMWLATSHAGAYILRLGALLQLAATETMLPEEPLPGVDEFNDRVRRYVELAEKNRTRPLSSKVTAVAGDWTGQDFPLAGLMHCAVERPNEFCKILVAGLLVASTKRPVRQRPQYGSRRRG